MIAVSIAAIIMVLSSSTIGLSKSQMDGVEIEITSKSSDLPNNPRGPVFNPFTAFLQNNNVILESDSSFGLVNVVLISTAGDYYTVVFDTEDVSIQIPVSGNSGYYCLCLTTESGMEFYGEFNM